MLPNVRLLAAAMLASILLLMCGVFAAFRLTAAIAPLQLVAANGANEHGTGRWRPVVMSSRGFSPASMSSAILVTRETVDQLSQFDTAMSAPEETTAPTGTAEQHDPAEFATESGLTVAPQPAAATGVELSAGDVERIP